MLKEHVAMLHDAPDTLQTVFGSHQFANSTHSIWMNMYNKFLPTNRCCITMKVLHVVLVNNFGDLMYSFIFILFLLEKENLDYFCHVIQVL